MLRRNKVAQKLNEEDLQSLKTFFPKIFEASLKGRKRIIRSERDALIRNTKTVTDKIFLDEVIKDFEANLIKKPYERRSGKSFLRKKYFGLWQAMLHQLINKMSVSM